MIVLMTIVSLAIIVVLLLHLRKVARERDHLRKVSEAWIDFACAVEATVDCDIDLKDTDYDDATERERLYVQAQNASDSATSALLRLRELGEYLDAYECSPFLPHAESYEESIEFLRVAREKYA